MHNALLVGAPSIRRNSKLALALFAEVQKSYPNRHVEKMPEWHTAHTHDLDAAMAICTEAVFLLNPDGSVCGTIAPVIEEFLSTGRQVRVTVCSLEEARTLSTLEGCTVWSTVGVEALLSREASAATVQ